MGKVSLASSESQICHIWVVGHWHILQNSPAILIAARQHEEGVRFAQEIFLVQFGAPQSHCHQLL